jgi:hypothetical protein
MGKRTNNQIQSQLISQNNQMMTLFNQAYAKANEKSPMETDAEGEYMDWRKFMKSGDFRNAPGLTFAGMWRAGLANRENERTGVGGAQLAQAAANPTAIAMQREHNSLQMAETGAQEYTDAIQGRDAMMRGQGSFLMNQQQNRMLNLAGLAGNMSSNATKNMISFQPAPSPWWGIASAAVGGLSSMFTGRYGSH